MRQRVTIQTLPATVLGLAFEVIDEWMAELRARPERGRRAAVGDAARESRRV